MGDREKKLAALTALIVVLGLVVDRVYAPLRERWTAAHDTREQLRAAVEQNEILSERAPEKAAERDAIYAALPDADDLALDPELRALLQARARNAGLQIQSIGRQGRRQLGERGLVEIWLPVELRTVPYPNLVHFLRALREADGLVKVSSLNLRMEPNGKLSASLRLSALARVEPEAEDVK